MPVTPWLPTVNKIKDGTEVSAAVVNPISTQHAQRTQHLYEKFQELSGKSVLIAYEQPILASSVSDVRKNTVVFYDREGAGPTANEGISPALVEFSSTNTFSSVYSPASSSYAMGIVRELSSGTASVYLLGLVELDVDIDDPTYGMIQSDEIDQNAELAPGPLYLSRTEAGKLTRNPGGIAIYIGYVFNRRTLLLAPNVSEFNQFFTTYKFNVLDRPAGVPTLVDGTWDVIRVSETGGEGGVDFVGWVPVASLIGGPIESLIPEGAKFYYNLPSDARITSDTGIDSDLVLRDEQLLLARALPPNPTNISLLTVNGIIQSSRDNNADGVYVINSAGIWWFADEDGQQPWASDMLAGSPVTFANATNELTIPNGAFEIGDRVRLISYLDGAVLTNLPPEFDEDVTYYVISQEMDGDDQIIKVSTTEGGSEVNFSTNGGSNCYVANPYSWKFYKGTDEYRPRMSLQFLKFNPALRESIVTSIKKYDVNSTALRFYSPDKITEATAGDLLARIFLAYADSGSTDTAATAVTSLSFDADTGITQTTSTPVVAELVEGSGISIQPRTVGGVVKPGSFIVSSSTNTQSGKVSYIEPDGAELLYSGLHSYLNMPPASTLPSSLTGKILLPSNTPDADLTLILLLMGRSSLTLGSTAKVVNFDFSYAVTKPGSVIDPTISPTTVTFNIPNTSAAYSARTVLKVGNVPNLAPYSIPMTMKVPSTAFKGGDCAVNFRLTRKTPVANAYVGDLGIIDIYWKIG